MKVECPWGYFDKGEFMSSNIANSLRFWVIKKLIPHYTSESGQDLAIKLWHWVSPHIENAGYEWAWANKPQGARILDYPQKGFLVWSFVSIGNDLTLERVVKLLGKDKPNFIQVTEWQHKNVMREWATFRGVPVRVVPDTK